VKTALPLLAVAVAVAVAGSGCGEKKPDAYAKANLALLDRLPVYPGAAAPKTSAGSASSTEFGARDWTLPAGTTQQAVIRWYEQRLPPQGWKITGESFGTIRAVRRGAAVSIGVRGRTLEVIANSRGG
jgi:hypothetical protein